MSSAGKKRTRSERVAALELPPSQWERTWASLRRGETLARIALALLAATTMCVVIRGWEPPFGEHLGFNPSRDIVARVPFTKADPVATEAERQRRRSVVRYVYTQDPLPLAELRAQLRNTVVQVTAAKSLADLDPKVWRDFQVPSVEGAAPPTPEDEEEKFREFRAAVAGKENLERFEKAMVAALAPFEQRGLLEKLAEDLGKANQEEILVHPRGAPEPLQVVKVSDVLIGDRSAVQQSLHNQFGSPAVADRLFYWIRPRLRPTLTPDLGETERAMKQAVASVQPVLVTYAAGQTLAKAGDDLTADQVQLLAMEHEAALAQRPLQEKIIRGVAVTGLTFALLVLCGVYKRLRQRQPVGSLIRMTTLLLLAIFTVAVARWASVDPWRAEITPLLLFGMTMAIVYRQELALLLCGVLAFLIALGVGHGLHEFLLLLGVTTVANLNLGRIRSRSKLIYVGLAAGSVAALLEIALAVIDNQRLDADVAGNALRTGAWVLAAGFVMTGLLPFIERLFGVLTDLSLLELGDVTHPLLQELVRRAPSTYNHSLTVGAIAEAAADSIGARGLLVRVGAYFHDIGKMLKPAYFIENQKTDANLHEALVPAMSTLVIIAHIKDGADLARQHRLPQPIIDLIAQHHGTTLVEFFYDRANEQKQSDPNGGEVDESTFRYPGPKPQTKEAAVLMLADAVESASRTLVDPTPARIEGLVRELAERRLDGGQFDESGLTLRELRTIERSMVMSLTSIYHGRIKYPEQKTA
jgi:putative nucleotidyltransferase with HDIG domain